MSRYEMPDYCIENPGPAFKEIALKHDILPASDQTLQPEHWTHIYVRTMAIYADKRNPPYSLCGVNALNDISTKQVLLSKDQFVLWMSLVAAYGHELAFELFDPVGAKDI